MAITQGVCNSYKKELLEGLHSLLHIYKIALFTSLAVLNKNTVSYIGTSFEVPNGNGYTTGGKSLTGLNISLINDTAILDFDDVSWSPASFTVRGALIYNDSLPSKNAVAVLDLGSEYTASNEKVTIMFPAVGEATSLIRVN